MSYTAKTSKDVIAEAFIKKVVSSYDMDESYLPAFKSILMDVMTGYEGESVADAKPKRAPKAPKPKAADVAEPAPAAVVAPAVSAPAVVGTVVAPAPVVVEGGGVATEKKEKKNNCYNLFIKEKMKTLPENLSQKERMKMCADLWNACDQATKDSYRAKAAAL